MKKYLIVVVVAVLVSLLGYLVFRKTCKQPEEIDIALTQLLCAQSIDSDSFRARLCKVIHNAGPDCEFTEQDLDKMKKLFVEEVDKCAIATLKEDNMCVDKYESLK